LYHKVFVAGIRSLKPSAKKDIEFLPDIWGKLKKN